MTSSYNINAAAPLETTVKGPSPPENRNNFNTFCPDYKQNHQSLELLGKAQNSTGSILNYKENVFPLEMKNLSVLESLSSNYGNVSYSAETDCS